MEFEQLLKLIDHVSESKLTTFQYENGDTKISMKCHGKYRDCSGECGELQGTVSGSVILSGGKGAIKDDADGQKTELAAGNVISSPLVGVFYEAPAEDAPPFVKVGDKVAKGQVIAIVEAMKLMNDIESVYDGEIAEIYVKNGEAVEYGQPLFRVV